MSSALSTLRRPEHTGERRCWPCTITNGALLALAVVAVARTRRRALAICLAVVGAAAIWLRGYLVPYTPWFAPRLAARLPDDPFHVGEPVSPRQAETPISPGTPTTANDPDTHSETPDMDAETPDTNAGMPGSISEEGPGGEAILAALLDAGVLVDDGDTIALTDETRERWRTEMEQLRELDTDALAAVVGETAPTAGATPVENEGDEWIVLTAETGSIGRGVWLTRTVAIAETAAVRALADEFNFDARIAAARPLRMFLETCPVCDESVSETTTIQCCGGMTTPKLGPQDVLACEACDEWLFTFPPG